MSDAPSPRIVTELKVSGHLMALDAGVFCVFHAPGGQPPDEQTGLPGVRLSLPPGQAADRIAISTFRDDGWIGGSDNAALIRVDRGPAQVLVTIYQSPDGAHEAPRLQVVKLTEAPAGQADAQAEVGQAAVAPAAAPGGQVGGQAGGQTGGQAGGRAPPAASDQPAPEAAEIAAHIQGRGDVLAKLDGWMGERGSKAWIEGFAIAPRQVIGSEDIEYQAVLGRGWLSPWAEGGKFCGSRGMGLPILGLSVRLKGAAAQRYDCRVQASFVDGSTAAPTAGEPCQAESLAPLEAFRVEILPRAARRAGAPATHTEDAAAGPVAGPAAAGAAAKDMAAKRAGAPARPRASAKQAALMATPGRKDGTSLRPAPRFKAPGRTAAKTPAKTPAKTSAKTPAKLPAKPGGRGRR